VEKASTVLLNLSFQNSLIFRLFFFFNVRNFFIKKIYVNVFLIRKTGSLYLCFNFFLFYQKLLAKRFTDIIYWPGSNWSHDKTVVSDQLLSRTFYYVCEPTHYIILLIKKKFKPADLSYDVLDHFLQII
jgi:hypothetical protein